MVNNFKLEFSLVRQTFVKRKSHRLAAKNQKIQIVKESIKSVNIYRRQRINSSRTRTFTSKISSKICFLKFNISSPIGLHLYLRVSYDSCKETEELDANFFQCIHLIFCQQVINQQCLATSKSFDSNDKLYCISETLLYH